MGYEKTRRNKTFFFTCKYDPSKECFFYGLTGADSNQFVNIFKKTVKSA